MIITRSDLILDHIEHNPVPYGLVIKKRYENEVITIAYIYWDVDDNNCFIKTVGENFQDNIVLYDDFKDFIYLVDEAYRMVSVTNGKRENTGF